MIGLGQALSVGLASGKTGGGFAGALDGWTTGLQECWSHRRKLVNKAPSTLMQVRRTSDDAVLNVGALTNGELDESSLTGFAGSGTLALASLTGQMNSVDFLQPTSTSQRILVDGGSLVEVGGKASSRGIRGPLSPDAQGGGMFTETFTTYSGNVLTLFLRGSHDVYNGWFTSIVDAYFGFGKDLETSSAAHTTLYRARSGKPGLAWIGDFGGAFESDYLISLIWDGTSVTFRDGVNTYSMSAGAAFDFNRLMFGCLRDADDQDYCSQYHRWQEAALWYSDQTANEAAIRSALMS